MYAGLYILSAVDDSFVGFNSIALIAEVNTALYEM
jgi:hypothetical protein